MATLTGRLHGAEHRRFALCVARFNRLITDRLAEGAVDVLLRHGVPETSIDLVYVPGAFELPLTALALAETGRYDAVLCLGALIRGATPHFDHISSCCTSGIAQVGMKTGVPTIYGVLTCDSIEQAIERAGTKAGNKGAEAAEAALEMADVFARIPGLGAVAEA